MITVETITAQCDHCGKTDTIDIEHVFTGLYAKRLTYDEAFKPFEEWSKKWVKTEGFETYCPKCAVQKKSDAAKRGWIGRKLRATA